ncbi:MAG: hypothetical protein WDZ61_00035 [Parcubacteria group bacterium]
MPILKDGTLRLEMCQDHCIVHLGSIKSYELFSQEIVVQYINCLLNESWISEEKWAEAREKAMRLKLPEMMTSQDVVLQWLIDESRGLHPIRRHLAG